MNANDIVVVAMLALGTFGLAGCPGETAKAGDASAKPSATGASSAAPKEEKTATPPPKETASPSGTTGSGAPSATAAPSAK
jgi:hypothetical protein